MICINSFDELILLEHVTVICKFISHFTMAIEFKLISLVYTIILQIRIFFIIPGDDAWQSREGSGCRLQQLSVEGCRNASGRATPIWIQHKDNSDLHTYSVLPIHRGLFSHNNLRKTPITRPLGRGSCMGVFREILVWPKFYLRI